MSQMCIPVLSNVGIQSAKIDKYSTPVGFFLGHTRSSRSSRAAKGIREDGGGGGAHPDELGECVHGGRKSRGPPCVSH